MVVFFSEHDKSTNGSVESVCMDGVEFLVDLISDSFVIIDLAGINYNKRDLFKNLITFLKSLFI